MVDDFDGQVSVGVTIRPRRVDARENAQRILEAAHKLLIVDPGASLEHVAQAAGVGRATVHRHFSSRERLIAALTEHLTERYRAAIEKAELSVTEPLFALRRLTEAAFELKTSYPFVTTRLGGEVAAGPTTDPIVLQGLAELFTRLYEEGHIAVDDPQWATRVYLAMLHEVHELPGDAAALQSLPSGEGEDRGGARSNLVVGSVLGALGHDRLRSLSGLD